jgi:hypothetical protein
MLTNRWTRTSNEQKTYVFYVSMFSLIQQFTLTLWNPTVHPVVHHARVPVRTDYTVRDPTGLTVASEVI